MLQASFCLIMKEDHLEAAERLLAGTEVHVTKGGEMTPYRQDSFLKVM